MIKNCNQKENYDNMATTLVEADSPHTRIVIGSNPIVATAG